MRKTKGFQRLTRVRPLGVLCALIAGCGDRPDVAAPAGPDPGTVAGVWGGVFPCDNCPGIDVTLWLRPDGRFFVEQRYRPAEGDAPDVSYGLGRWAWRTDEQLLALSGAGPARLYERPDEDVLLLRTAAIEPHRLEARPGAADFTAVIRVRGVAQPAGDGYRFRECLTGYAVPLGKGGDYRRFARQFLDVVPRGEAASAEFEGRFDWGADGAPAAFHIERFVTLREARECS